MILWSGCQALRVWYVCTIRRALYIVYEENTREQHISAPAFSCLNCIRLLQELGYMYLLLSRGFPETATEPNLDLSRRHLTRRLSRSLLCKMAQTRDPGKHHQRNIYTSPGVINPSVVLCHTKPKSSKQLRSQSTAKTYTVCITL